MRPCLPVWRLDQGSNTSSPREQQNRVNARGRDWEGWWANFNRGLVIGDEMEAGILAAEEIISGRSKIRNLRDVGDVYAANLDYQRALEDDYKARHPYLAANANAWGQLGSLAIPGGPIGKAVTRFAPAGASIATKAAVAMGNAARGGVAGAVAGATQGLADRGDAQERLTAALSGAKTALAFGAMAGPLAGVVFAPRKLDPTPPVPKATDLPLMERRTLTQELLEENIGRRLRERQSEIPGAHFLDRHGAHLDIGSQYERVAKGLDPMTGEIGRAPPFATRFLRARDQFNALDRAEQIYRRSDSTRIRRPLIDFEETIGEGYDRGLNYSTQTAARVYLNSQGQPVTAFPQYGR